MRLGLLIASMSRSAGGLYHSVSSLSAIVQNLGVDSLVYAGRDAFSDLDRQGWAVAQLNIQRQIGPAGFGFQPALLSTMRQAALDIVHLHGLWMYPSIAALRWSSACKPVIISPHGMLDPWALRNSSWKKWIALRLYEDVNLRRAACLHALCEAEFRAMRDLGLTNPVAIIPNGANLDLPKEVTGPPLWAGVIPPGSKVLLFLGRIHPKKGIETLIRAMALKRNRGGSNEWILAIAGWDDGGHEYKLKKLAQNLGVDSIVHFVGPQFGVDKANSLAAAHAFVLPSLSEGLPMAVLEAWSFSLPVLMTTECNLPEGFAAKAAMRLDHDPTDMARQLSDIEDMSPSDLGEMGRNGRHLAEKKFSWDTIGEQMYSVYRWTLEGGDAPDCIYK